MTTDETVSNSNQLPRDISQLLASFWLAGVTPEDWLTNPEIRAEWGPTILKTIDDLLAAAHYEQVGFDCADCGIDTSAADEYYMLHDRVWRKAAGKDIEAMLCIGCVETRLGRKLTPRDFTKCAVNRDFAKSARLHARLGHADRSK